MRIEHVYREMNGVHVVKRTLGKGEALPAVMLALGYSWLPGLIGELGIRNFGFQHPQDKEWFAVFEINYRPESQPTGNLLIRPAVRRHVVPAIGLAQHRPLSYRTVRRYLEIFLAKRGP